ncbi:glutamine-hydrolyzing carbamoyl-phosphate synthase small subunit [Candidatus Micrarchaeota archaeon]|nr:glutamine-hydrolyzing carbamoyl-phosphate synthase small subunit [Candidatus Micrarchaeota archaeon]
MKAVLALKDGTVLFGTGFGAKGERVGELVFNTSMTGYQEALTDPSYAGQILLMTYPLIGNYGTNARDRESGRVHPSGFAVRQVSPDREHREADNSLQAFLGQHGIPAISGIDTRFLVRHIRDKGVMPAIISVSDQEINAKQLVERLKGFDYSSVDFVSQVSTPEPVVYGKGRKVALLDFGAKLGIARELVKRGCEVHMLPCHTSADKIKELEPEGIMLSNGPGDPSIPGYAHRTIRNLAGYCPMFGVCLGHQLIAHAMGGSTYKLKFGHRGSNHPVQDLQKGRVAITTQNHGFAVKELPKGFELTHVNVNDGSIEGMRCRDKGIFSVQYHPEASPGPHDSGQLFDEFVRMM